MNYPPQNLKEFERLLKKLGFQKVRRTGKGNHAHKYKHPLRTTYNQRPFIVIPTKIHKVIAKVILKEIQGFGFSSNDIKNCCSKRIRRQIKD